jgi:hypothetical protein
MGFRIDPINEHGIFDHDFYASDIYSNEVEILKNYLYAEGFDQKEDQFSICYRNRSWLVKPNNTQERRKK